MPRAINILNDIKVIKEGPKDEDLSIEAIFQNYDLTLKTQDPWFF